MRLFHVIIASLIFLLNITQGQPTVMNSAEIQLALQRLNVLGSAMYIAAHPDDENTAVLAYLANERKVRTAYLSLTRGDGGQNRIGSEKGPMLGMIRTEELLNARRIDGAIQFFTRAVDFGYSKSSTESLRFWNHDSVLSDVVLAIRRFRPDVLITRFSPETGGHGHHLASAILAKEAFFAAGDPSRFPQHLSSVTAWQPVRLLWNAWSGALESAEVDTSGVLAIDVGGFNPLKGQTYTEIAAISRSQHKCQGFGASPRRESQIEHFVHTAGKPAEKDPLEGIETADRLENDQIVRKLQALQSSFNPARPADLVPALVEAYRLLNATGRSYWQQQKLEDIKTLIASCSGLWYEATADDFTIVPGDSMTITGKIVVRTDVPMQLLGIEVAGGGKQQVGQLLTNNKPYVQQRKMLLDHNIAKTNPYWLDQPARGALFSVRTRRQIGKPQEDSPLQAAFTVRIGQTDFTFDTSVMYSWTDPQRGERRRDIEIVEPVSFLTDAPMYLFASDRPQQMMLTLLTHQSTASGSVNFETGEGWRIEPSKIDFQAERRGGELRVPVKIYPPQNAGRITLRPRVSFTENGESLFARTLHRIDYDHIPIRLYQPPLQIDLIKVDVETPPRRIAYIPGSGDEVPQALQRMGYQPDLIDAADITPELLRQYQVVIAGVRAYNVHPEMAAKQAYLQQFMENGGTYIVQYNTAHRLVTSPGPYPMQLSRFRITDETAEIRLLKPQHRILNTPNNISSSDFQDWVQERGLYFAGEWDPRYQAILGGNDPGEPSRDGGLLVAEVGKGMFIYSGYSWFRQLPAGVPGAFRLFSNLINARQDR